MILGVRYAAVNAGGDARIPSSLRSAASQTISTLLHDQLQQELDARGSATGAPELHGIACGLVATGAGVGPLIDMLAEQDSAGEVDPGLEAMVEALMEEGGERLADDSFAFEPWLPADEAPLGERIIALADWCGGFLLGLTMGGLGDPAKLPEDAGEAARDLVAISGASDDPGDDPDAAERQLAELAEFVRVGAMLIFEEIRGGGRGAADGSEPAED